MNFAEYYRSIVRIEVNNMGFDWSMPFQRMQTKPASGSGFFIDKKGYVLTCAHVVEDAEYVRVEIPSEGDRKYDAEVMGVCPFFDLALIWVKDYKPKTVCKLDAGSTKVTPGMETYALGYPLGMPHLKVSKGIISGQQYNFYQTDTAINPGNSGGPLLYQGRVIGVNAAGIAAWAADGIGYAVPITRYHSIKTFLRKSRHLIAYPQFFGFEDFQPTSSDFQKFMKNRCKHGGVYIKSVLPKSPVSTTGLRKGHILCAIDGVNIDYYGGLKKRWMNETMSIENALAEVGLNRPVKITYWDGKTLRNDHFELGIYTPNVRLMYPAFERIPYETCGGIIVMDLCVNLIMILGDVELAEYLKPKNIMEKRLVVSNVLVGSYASTLNIVKKGDLIVRVNDKPVSTVAQYRRALAKPVGDKSFVKIETENNKLMLLPVKQLAEDDKELSKRYMYPPSKIF